MTRHTAGVARRAVRNAGMVRGSLLLGLLLLTFPLSGCSILIYHAYKEAAIAQGYDWMEISALETRGEVHEKLGKPADAFSCPEGTRLDSYHLPGKINPCVQFKFKSHSSCGPLDEASDAFGIVLLGVRSLGISELVMTPMVLWEAHKAEQARAEWHVAFVYDAEDHILYRYDAAPGDEEGVVLGPLTHQVQHLRHAPLPQLARLRGARGCRDAPLRDLSRLHLAPGGGPAGGVGRAHRGGGGRGPALPKGRVGGLVLVLPQIRRPLPLRPRHGIGGPRVRLHALPSSPHPSAPTHAHTEGGIMPPTRMRSHDTSQPRRWSALAGARAQCPAPHGVRGEPRGVECRGPLPAGH